MSFDKSLNGDFKLTNNLLKKWKGFGWNCIKINGHKLDDIYSAISKTKKNIPTVIISKTIKGKGVKFVGEQIRRKAGKSA